MRGGHPLPEGESIPSTTDVGGSSLGLEYSNPFPSASFSPGAPTASSLVSAVSSPAFPRKRRNMVALGGLHEAAVSAETSVTTLVSPLGSNLQFDPPGYHENGAGPEWDQPRFRGAGQMELRAQEYRP